MKELLVLQSTTMTFFPDYMLLEGTDTRTV